MDSSVSSRNPPLCGLEPQERLKRLIDYVNTVEVDFHVSPKKYYRSGLEMVRMANVYYNEGSLENAYILYLKFMTLFLEKIRKHPEFNSVPTNEKATNQATLREILPRAEKLKSTLLAQYKDDYEKYLEKLKQRELEEKQNKEKGLPNKPDKSGFNINATTTKNDDSIYDMSYTNVSLRTVIVPSQVMSSFQTRAENNTLKNVETCGILAGKLQNHILIITHMIIPKQKGTSDSCTTMNEEEIFEIQDQYNLVTIGWIHTHPTQSAFLSSVDLHTHLPYQLLMPEAIAIVVSPKHSESGIFILTDYGLREISHCRSTGFHPHSTGSPLFMIADNVRIDYHAHVEVIDLR